jgi:hypothetical protein
MVNDELTEWTVRDGVIFWLCLTCNRIAQDTCGAQHEIAAIPAPPLDARMN